MRLFGEDVGAELDDLIGIDGGDFFLDEGRDVLRELLSIGVGGDLDEQFEDDIFDLASPVVMFEVLNEELGGILVADGIHDVSGVEEIV